MGRPGMLLAGSLIVAMCCSGCAGLQAVSPWPAPDGATPESLKAESSSFGGSLDVALLAIAGGSVLVALYFLIVGDSQASRETLEFGEGVANVRRAINEGNSSEEQDANDEERAADAESDTQDSDA